MHCEQVSRDAQSLRLRLPEAHKHLLASFGDRFKTALAERLGPAVKVEIELTASAVAATPAAARAREQAQRQGEAEAAIHNDPFVQTLVRDCGATVSNIRPLTGTHD
jgi:DNA polymerase-3 subunit gamma/tau